MIKVNCTQNIPTTVTELIYVSGSNFGEKRTPDLLLDFIQSATPLVPGYLLNIGFVRMLLPVCDCLSEAAGCTRMEKLSKLVINNSSIKEFLNLSNNSY